MTADTTTQGASLLPCPFCGHDTPEFERIGTSSQSCIVACGNCGGRHESGDEYLASGTSWNRRAQAPAPQGIEVVAYVLGDIRIEKVVQKAGPSKWAVRRTGDVLNKTGGWEWEPSPSSRDETFLERCRFDSAEDAIHAAHGITKRGGT